MSPQPAKNVVIDKDRVQEHALDFNFLRAKGIELIQQFAGKQWSDFNLHDPGVTMLEYVCYGLTDVAYRTTFPIVDLLADKKGNINRSQNFFLPREEALSSGPVTVNDYRKLLIDRIPGVDNVWLEPVAAPMATAYVKGIYRVIIKPDAAVIEQLNAAVEAAVNEIVDQLILTVRSTLMSYRNIGDHYEDFQVLRPQPIYIKAEVIIEKNAFPELIMAEIYEALAQVLNPRVRFYSEEEMLAKGFAIEDIYSGPLLQQGIIPDSELQDRTTALDPFTLIKAISGIKGVVSIKRIQLSSDGKDYHSKVLSFTAQVFPFLQIDGLNPDITLYDDSYPLYIQKLDILKKEHQTKRKLSSSGVQKKQDSALKGEYKNLEDYVSIQTLFPAIYGINEESSASSLPPATIAKSRQLKAYLMLFEQLLANSLSQLANISDLFSTDISADKASSYYFQPLYSVPDAKYILKAFTGGKESFSTADWAAFKQDPANKFIQDVRQFIETDEQYKDRKKRAFDHMLSRFNIAVHKHPVYLYKFYYDRENSGQRADMEIRWKAAILRNLSAFTSNRIKADNYLTLNEDEGLENGFGRKMSLLLHIKSGTRNRLSKIIEQYKNHLAVATAAAEDNQPEDRIRLNWRDEELHILFNKNDGEIEEDLSLSSNVTFKCQSERLFQSAIVLKNYRIIPYNQETVLLFKHPQDTRWNMLSKHKDEYAALKALKKTIHLFKEISMDSEGFYMLEHLLLKPPLAEQHYGFNFADQSGKPLIRQLHWQSFSQREETVMELLSLAKSFLPENLEGAVTRLKTLCAFTPDLVFFSDQLGQHLNEDQRFEESISYLFYNLQQFAIRSTDFYPAFHYTVRTGNEQEISEDFFSFRMTIVFPSWPARFQDISFKELAEDLFKEECPAHIKLSFLWLSLPQIKLFDELYFPWLNAVKDGINLAPAQLLSQQLTQFLISHNVYPDNLNVEDNS